jgi:hypothetical protein
MGKREAREAGRGLYAEVIHGSKVHRVSEPQLAPT